MYESPDDAKEAITHLNGFNFSGRYIVGKSGFGVARQAVFQAQACRRKRRATELISVLYHHPSKQQASAVAKAEIRAREQALADEKRRLGLHDEV